MPQSEIPFRSLERKAALALETGLVSCPLCPVSDSVPVFKDFFQLTVRLQQRVVNLQSHLGTHAHVKLFACHCCRRVYGGPEEVHRHRCECSRRHQKVCHLLARSRLRTPSTSM